MNTRVRVTIVAAVAVLIAAFPAVASAKFTRSATGSMSVGTDTLVAPTGVTVTKNCSLFNTTVTVTWTATTDQYATGYTLTTSQGTTSTTQTITGRTATSATIDIGRYKSTTFTLASSYKTWTSTNTTATSAVQCGLLG